MDVNCRGTPFTPAQMESPRRLLSRAYRGASLRLPLWARSQRKGGRRVSSKSSLPGPGERRVARARWRKAGRGKCLASGCCILNVE